MTSIQSAIKMGLLIRPEECEGCHNKPGYGKIGQALIQAHHYLGYSKEHELDVQWLCPKCHLKVHRFPEPWDDQRRKEYADRARARTGWHHSEEARAKIRENMGPQAHSYKCDPGCKCKRHTNSGNWS
jgi:hypothetical protein